MFLRLPLFCLMEDSATIRIGNDNYDLSIITGTEDESALDIRSLRKQSGFITFDDGYGNTGSCESKVTFIDGDKGILRYRGYPIEELAEKSTFLESAYLVIYGELPNHEQLTAFRQRVSDAGVLPDSVSNVIESFPQDAHPMAVLSAGIHALGTCHPDKITNDRVKDLEAFDESAAIIISAIRKIAAWHHRSRMGLTPIKSNPEKAYCENFLSMMFSNKPKWIECNLRHFCRRFIIYEIYYLFCFWRRLDNIT